MNARSFEYRSYLLVLSNAQYFKRLEYDVDMKNTLGKLSSSGTCCISEEIFFFLPCLFSLFIFLCTLSLSLYIYISIFFFSFFFSFSSSSSLFNPHLDLFCDRCNIILGCFVEAIRNKVVCVTN